MTENTSDKPTSPLPPDQVEHNLENQGQPEKINPEEPPTRQPGEDDFAAEAHGFTGYEKVGEATEKYKNKKERDRGTADRPNNN